MSVVEYCVVSNVDVDVVVGCCVVGCCCDVVGDGVVVVIVCVAVIACVCGCGVYISYYVGVVCLMLLSLCM